MSDVKFQIGDIAHNLQLNEKRYVIDMDNDALIVLADESKGKQSNRNRWLIQNCTLNTPCPFHIGDEVTLGNGSGAPGKIVEIKPHYHGKWLMFGVERPQPSGGTMKNWANEGALHLVKSTPSVSAHVESVAYDLSPTDTIPASTSHDLSQVDDKLETCVGVQCDKCGRIYNSQHAECPDCRDTAQLRATFQSSPTDPRDADALMRAAQALADEQEKTLAAEARAEVAEKNNKKLLEQVNRLEGVICKPVEVQQTKCIEVCTLRNELDYSDTADARLAAHLNEGWEIVDVAITVHSEEYGDIAGAMKPVHTRIVTMKRTVSTPVQPTRGTASAAAALTSPFISQEMYRARQQQAVEPDAILEPVNNKRKIELGPIGKSMKEIGREETQQLMHDFAVQKAFAAGAERIANMPDFNRPLHTLKANN